MAEDDDAFDEVPVDDLIVDLRSFQVRLPDGTTWAAADDFDPGVIPEARVEGRSLSTVAEALGLLSEHVQEGAPEGYYLEIDPPDRMAEIELHEGVALQSYGSDQLYATVSIGLPVDLDPEFEQNVEDTVARMLELRGAACRVSRVNLLFEHQVVVMVRFTEMGWAGRSATSSGWPTMLGRSCLPSDPAKSTTRSRSGWCSAGTLVRSSADPRASGSMPRSSRGRSDAGRQRRGRKGRLCDGQRPRRHDSHTCPDDRGERP